LLNDISCYDANASSLGMIEYSSSKQLLLNDLKKWNWKFNRKRIF